MGIPFYKNILQVGVKIHLSTNIDYHTIKLVVDEINLESKTHFDFSLYNGFYHPSTKNEILLTSYNLHDYFDTKHINALEKIQDSLRNITIASFRNSIFFIGGVFIYIEKFI